MLTVESLKSGYGKILVLSGVDVDVSSGEVVTLVGTNGSGKTTLLKTICGLIPIYEGRILFGERDISRLPAVKRIPLGIALVPESREIFAHQSVLANLKLGAYSRLKRLRGGTYQSDLDLVLSVFPHLATRLKQTGATLSGGEQQMLAIGRALMSRPRLLVLDEPSTGLAPALVKEIFKSLRWLNRERNLTMFLVEQNTRLALALAHRGYVIQKGRIVRRGEAATLSRELDRAGLLYGDATGENGGT